MHLCAPRTGSPGTPLEAYGPADLRRAFDERKACAATCPVVYAHQLSQVDQFRPQRNEETPPPPPTAPAGAKHLPVLR